MEGATPVAAAGAAAVGAAAVLRKRANVALASGAWARSAAGGGGCDMGHA